MPTSLSELGIAPTQENLMLLYDKILHSSAMAGTTKQEQDKLLQVLKTIQ